MDRTNKTVRESKLLEYWEETKKGNRLWRQDAIQNYEFVCNDQWDSAERSLLEEEEKPCLTINHVLPIINLLSGMERQNRADIKAFPRKGGTRIIADAFTSLVKHSVDMCHGETEQSIQFTDGLISGKGWLKTDISFKKDKINGDLVMRRKSPFDVYEDPNANRYDLNESGKYIVECFWGDKEQIKLLYSEHADAIEKYTGDPRDEDMTDAKGKLIKKSDKEDKDPSEYRFRLKEIWWKSYKKQLFLIDGANMSFSPVHDSQKEVVKVILEKERRLAEREQRRPRYHLKEHIIEVLHMTTMLGEMILEDIEDPYDGMTMFPLQRFSPYWFDGVTFGVVEGLKDPQKEINKRTSQMLHIINHTANTGWIVKDSEQGTKDILEKEGSKPGVQITYSNTPPEKIEPNTFPQGLFILKQDEEANIKKISGLNPDILGQGDKRTDSGIAILRRQRQGATISEPVYDNFRLSQRIFGETLIEMIRHSNVYSPAEVAHIMQEEKQEIDIEQLYKAMKSWAIGHYGYRVDQKSHTPTVRMANLEILMQMAQAGLPIPIDVIIENSDIPNKEEIVQRVREEAKRVAEEEQQQQRQPARQQAKGKASPPKMQSNVGKV
ncbi:hypothetical protein KAX08_08780 [candidate division WOR-3 bacterium]|nr:hypothetical protein [candidate division WOR-3 bacterium]